MRRLGWLTAWLGALLVATFASLAVASDDHEDRGSRVPRHAEAKPQGDKCVEDTEFMKRNHMNLILHQRDKTMHQGIRTTKYSLKNCIACHATPTKANPEVRSVLGEGHFCQSCHAYNAVKIDCFECHSSKPSGDMTAGHGLARAQNVSADASLNPHLPGVSYELRPSLNQNAPAGAAK
jgi:hypothetical protein